YCAPSGSVACGAGTCKTNPMFCPLHEILGACGCDGTAYMNANCAEVHGTTSEGDRRIAGAAIADVAGSWSRVVSTDLTAHVRVTEALTVGADGTFTLSQAQSCWNPGHICFHSVRLL